MQFKYFKFNLIKYIKYFKFTKYNFLKFKVYLRSSKFNSQSWAFSLNLFRVSKFNNFDPTALLFNPQYSNNKS